MRRVTFVILLAAACAAPPSQPPVLPPPVVVEPPQPEVTPPPVDEPAPARPEVRLPALCASYYASPTDPDLDLEAFAAFLDDTGQDCTRGWLIDAWSIGQRDSTGKFLPGQYDGRLPVVRTADGRFDLSTWNEDYWRHLRRYVDTLNARGVWPHLTFLELYSWSDRKASLPFVPDPNRGMFRFNVNGVKWGDPDDDTFFSLPDSWLNRFICRVVETLDGTAWAAEVGNEMPEKPMHFRIISQLRACGFRGLVTVNRNEDAPGQPWNMDVGGRVDAIAFHGKLSLDYLDELFPDEAPAGRPTTFRAMWGLVDPSRIILSSDGGGGNPALLPDLAAVALDTLRRGGSYEHQLALKRNRFYGDGTLRMADLAIDAEFLRRLAAAR